MLYTFRGIKGSDKSTSLRFDFEGNSGQLAEIRKLQLIAQ